METEVVKTYAITPKGCLALALIDIGITNYQTIDQVWNKLNKVCIVKFRGEEKENKEEL